MATGRYRVIGWLGAIPVLAFIALFALIPLATLFTFSYGQLGGWSGLWNLVWGPGLGAQLARGALRNSLEQASASAGLAVLWGYPVGVFLGRTRFRWTNPVRALLLIPFILPSLVMVFGVIGLFGPDGLIGRVLPSTQFLAAGLPGILFVNVLFNTPIVALYTATLVESSPANLEEAARVLGASSFTVYRTVWARPSWIGAALGGLLTFLFSFLSFAPPLLLGGPAYYTVEDWIYALDKFVGFGGTAMASGLAIWTVGLLAAPLVGYMLLSRGTNLLGRGKGTLGPRAESRQSGPLDYGLATLTAALVALEGLMLLTVLLLSIGLPTRSVTTVYWNELFSARTTAILQVPTVLAIFNTVFFASVATAIVFALALTFQIPPRKGGLRVEGLAFFPLLVSPVILALGLTMAWGSTLGSATSVWTLIVVSQASIALPFALQSLSGAFRAHPPTLAEAAACLGATRVRSFSEIELPLARAGVWTAVLFTAAIGLGEFAATNFLYVPNFTTLVVEMYLLQGVRLAGPAFAVGGILVLVSGAIFLLLLMWRDREE